MLTGFAVLGEIGELHGRDAGGSKETWREEQDLGFTGGLWCPPYKGKAPATLAVVDVDASAGCERGAGGDLSALGRRRSSPPGSRSNGTESIPHTASLARARWAAGRPLG